MKKILAVFVLSLIVPLSYPSEAKADACVMDM